MLVYQCHMFPKMYGVMNEICKCNALDMEFPKDLNTCEHLYSEFKTRSSGECMGIYVCDIDGFLCSIQVPHYNDSPFITGYFSCHYQCYGLKVQSACDSDCKFLYFYVKWTGGSNDIFAIEH